MRNDRDADATATGRSIRYVVDTHTLYWALRAPDRLGSSARAALRSAEAGHALVLVPAIVIGELYYLAMKHRWDLTPAQLLSDLDQTPGYSFSPTGRAQLEQLARLNRIPEMHDRLIAADAVVQDAILLTRDAALQDSGQVRTIW